MITPRPAVPITYSAPLDPMLSRYVVWFAELLAPRIMG